jgi:hypothetical protein
MPVTRESNVRARSVPDARNFETWQATLSSRPLRLAFLIHTATPVSKLLKYFEYVSAIWGGFFTALEGCISPIWMTRRDLSTTTESSILENFTCVFVGNDSIADFCLFWNIRMMPSLLRRSIEQPPAVQGFCDWLCDSY